MANAVANVVSRDEGAGHENDEMDERGEGIKYDLGETVIRMDSRSSLVIIAGVNQ